MNKIAKGKVAPIAAAERAKRPVVVLGMHKSGTTLVAETLHRSGIAMIESQAAGGYDDGNKMERYTTRRLNIEMLDCEGQLSVHVVKPLDPDQIKDTHWQRGRDVVAEQSLHGTRWGFKDPRTLLTWPFWESLIADPLLIGVFRHPVEVFAHYTRRPARRWLIDDPNYLTATLRAWCVYNRCLINIAQRNTELALYDYSDLMREDDEFRRMADHLKHPLVDSRRKDMQRSQPHKGLLYRVVADWLKARYRLDPDGIYHELRELTQKFRLNWARHVG